MVRSERSIGGINLVLMTLAGLTALFAVVNLVPAAHAQTYTVLHTFTGGGDGASPVFGLAMDGGGNIYGTTEYGGSSGDGTVFKLARLHSGWVLNSLHSFTRGYYGYNPRAGVTIGPDGALYGTTLYGGNADCIGGCGVVYRLRPPLSSPPSPQAQWPETVLHEFDLFDGDGVAPFADVAFDRAGNLYGTTFEGADYGIVYQLQPSGGNWTEQILHKFQGGAGDGAQPQSGVTIDAAGNLYGTAPGGGPGDWGVVYEVSPYQGGWVLNVLYAFQNNGIDGANPYGGVILDNAGNIYGSTTVGGQGFGGTIFELSPANGGWTYTVLYSLPGGFGPRDKLTMDGTGNLYGTTHEDGAYGYGNVFKLTHANGAWTYTSLYDFTNGSDGKTPDSRVVLDANGNIYGSASGGAQGNGVLFEITP